MAGGVELHFSGSEFSISEPEIWQKSLFLGNLRDFPAKVQPLRNIFGLWKMAIPCAANP